MIRFLCPHCQAVLKAAEQKRGTVKFCPFCKKQLKVPHARSTVPAAPADADEDEIEAQVTATDSVDEQAPTRGSSGGGGIAISGVAIVFGLGLFLVFKLGLSGPAIRAVSGFLTDHGLPGWLAPLAAI